MGIIQNAINQAIGTAAVAARLSPEFEKRQAEKAAHVQFETESKLREEAAATSVQAATNALDKYSQKEATLTNKSGHLQLESAISLNKEAQTAVERSLLYNPTEEGQETLKKLQQSGADLEMRRQKALDRVAKRQETIRKQREGHESFVNTFITDPGKIEQEFKKMTGGKPYGN